MKRISAIFFLSLLLLITVGYHALLHLQIAEVKSGMAQKLHAFQAGHDYTVLHLSANELKALQWDAENEFSWNGDMYDVLALSRNNGSWDLSCVADREETRLVRLYHKIAGDSEGGSLASVTLLKLILTTFIMQNAADNPAPAVRSVCLNIDRAIHLRHPKIDVDPLPPWTA